MLYQGKRINPPKKERKEPTDFREHSKIKSRWNTLMNELILQVAELVNEIKKQPDPYFEDLSKALNIYNALRNFESDFSSLSNKYSNSEKRYNLISFNATTPS